MLMLRLDLRDGDDSAARRSGKSPIELSVDSPAAIEFVDGSSGTITAEAFFDLLREGS